MERRILFVTASVYVVLIVLAVYLYVSVADLTVKVQTLDLEGRINEQLLTALENKPRIACDDVILSSPSGRQYIELQARAEYDGLVTLHVKNIYKEPVFFINFREVSVVYSRTEDKRMVVDSESAPTFKNSTFASCSANLFPGESTTCQLYGYYDAVINKTVEEGGNTFVIDVISVELDKTPYNFIASDLCVLIDNAFIRP